jgi:uncharacterized membrane protein YfcA
VFIKIIEVEPITLIVMFSSATIGAIIGAGIVSKLPENTIRFIMGLALLITAGFMFANKMQWIHGEGTEIGLSGWKLLIAGSVNFMLGALMTVGVGLYAPCMALVYLLGLSPQVAFPIMMGSCAFLMPPASFKFIKEGSYHRKAALGMAIPAVVAVLIAAFIVKSLPLDSLRSVVMAVNAGAEAVVVTVPTLVIVDSLVEISVNGVATNGNNNFVPGIGLSVDVDGTKLPVYTAVFAFNRI